MRSLKRTPKVIDRKAIKQEKLEKLESVIAYKKKLLSNAFKIPPAINQFSFSLPTDEKENLFAFLKNYKPETKKEKVERLKKKNPKEGSKPCLLKFGLNHVTDLIEQKKAKLVIIAADVDPIETVIFLPTLCVKMNIPYVIVDKREELGNLVNLKKTAVIALCDIKGSDEGRFAELLRKSKQSYNELYEMRMMTWGGGILLSKMKETVETAE
ncbi:hypothetical protein GVAV_000477 [Gurleya vavrai]